MNDNNKKPYFRVEVTDEDQIRVECDGSGQELMNLFANVINDNPDIAEVITLALMAVSMRKDEEAGVEGLSEDDVLNMLGGVKPVAEA
jgi:hypothetical protein